MIDDMVNLSVFHTPTMGRPTNLIFRSAAQKRLFAIFLADVLSRPKEKAFPFAFAQSGLPEKETDRTYLHYLEGSRGTHASGRTAQVWLPRQRPLPIG